MTRWKILYNLKQDKVWSREKFKTYSRYSHQYFKTASRKRDITIRDPSRSFSQIQLLKLFLFSRKG